MTTPYASPTPPVPNRRRRRGGVVGPLVLIFIGAVFLLQNAGYLPPTFWLNLWRLWPLVLVLAGIELLLAHRAPWPVVALLATVVLVAGAAASSTSLLGSSSSPATATSTETDLAGATQANVTVRFDAGNLDVGPIEQAARPDQLALMTYQGPPELMPRTNYTSGNGGIGRLEYQVSGHVGPSFIPFFGSSGNDATRMELDLSPTVPITTLTMQTGATDAHVDLSNLKINAIDMSVGAANTWLRLPADAGSSSLHISGGAANITVEIPQGVAAQIRYRGGLSALTIDQSRFPLVGDNMYRSPDFETAQNKVDINLETGATTIQVS